ncbi:hypothetical protein TRFO_02655 [Tritrichomonas foetus]|uniref:Uncharacterized protein n=1 Tax=Tritrichomonas foetus TaxID=1144522 RepID=A0A1J4L361_9EUKA|nr:hypothetical protein TRFO_02655 [Tritrichomonas foetus]|eukprot:OHT16412.1 hypothetical protein TRFO_02655 [Tritrichomonas foetus]
MNGVLDKINNLSQSKRLISSEQVIMGTVLELDQCMKSANLTEADLQNIQNSLLSLFSANNGDFSIQCSLYIASMILKTLQLSKNPQIWDLFNLVISNTKLTTIMAAGYVCRHIGNKFKAQLPRLIEHLLKQKYSKSFDYPIVYCLRAIFKVGGKSVAQYSQQAIDFAQKASIQNRQATTVGSIKLLKAIIQLSNPPVNSVLECVKVLTKSEQIPFIKNEIASLIARCAFVPLFPLINVKKKEKSEWIIGGMRNEAQSDLDKPLELLLMFPKYLKMSFSHFLNLLTPSMASNNHESLFNFAKKNCPSLLNEIIPMFPADARFTYFKDASKQNPSASQLQLLNALCPDSNSIYEAAGVALLLTCSGEKKAKHSALEFFASFTKSHPSIILSYLRSALVLLAQPPDNNTMTDRDTIGNTSLAYVIFKNMHHIDDAIDPNKDVLSQFFTDVFSPNSNPSNSNFNPLSLRFAGALLLLSILPASFCQDPSIKDYINISIATAIEILKKSSLSTAVLYNSQNNSAQNAVPISTLSFNKKMIKSLFAFCETHIDDKQNLDLVRIALKANIELPLSVIASMCTIAPLSGASDLELIETTKLVISRALKITPSADLMKSYISRPLPTGFDLLKYSNTLSFEKHREQVLLNKIIQSFPQLLSSINQIERQHVIDNLLNLKTVNSTAHLILLQLCKSSFVMPKTSLPLFLKHLETNNLTVLQIISECVSHFLAKNQKQFNTVFSFIESKKNIASCLLLSSIFTHTNVPNSSFVSRSLLLLNSLMKVGAILPFAVHSISSMLLTHSMQLATLGITLNEFSILFDTLNTNYSMQPVVLHLCAECFSLLVETSSSELAQTKSNLVSLLLCTFELTPVSYAREAYFECLRAIVTFAHSLQPKKMSSLSFPSSAGVSTSLQLCACEAFSDFLKFDDTIYTSLFNNDSNMTPGASQIPKSDKPNEFNADFHVDFTTNFTPNFNNSFNDQTRQQPQENNNNDDPNDEPNEEGEQNMLDHQKSNSSDFELNKIVSQLLNLLQKTGDSRCSSFIIALSNADKGQKISFWIGTLRRILIGNSLFQNIEIEPSASVKKCLLAVAYSILPRIAKQQLLATEYLDDIISSASHATETDRIELQESAFPILQRVIELFRHRISEDGGRMLDLYDSQFSQSVKIGFRLNLSISGGFLSTYLEFITDSLTSDSENCSLVLKAYLDGLRECKQRSSFYYSLATHLCAVSKKYSNVANMIHDFLIELIPVFTHVFFESVGLWKNKNDWRSLSKFRDFASTFYADLLPSLVWLQSIIEKPTIPPDVLLSFFLIEAKRSREPWMINGAFSALSVVIEYFGSSLLAKLIEISLQVGLDITKREDFITLIINSSKILKKCQEHNSLRAILVSLAMKSTEIFNKQVFANILTSDLETHSLTKYIPKIASYILDIFVNSAASAHNKLLNENEAVSLFSLIFHHSPHFVGFILNELISGAQSSNVSPEFKLQILKIGIPISEGAIPLRQISRFCIEMFKRGGMVLIGKVLIERPEIGFALLSQGNAKAAFLLCSNDLNNSRAYLRFIQLCLSSSAKISNNETKINFSKSVFKLSIQVLSQFGTDVQRGHQIVSLCVQIIQNIRGMVDENTLNDMFNSLNLTEKLALFKMMNLHISKAELRKRNQNLTAFSTSQRTRRGEESSEWQTLEIGDDSDSF